MLFRYDLSVSSESPGGEQSGCDDDDVVDDDDALSSHVTPLTTPAAHVSSMSAAAAAQILPPRSIPPSINHPTPTTTPYTDLHPPAAWYNDLPINDTAANEEGSSAARTGGYSTLAGWSGEKEEEKDTRESTSLVASVQDHPTQRLNQRKRFCAKDLRLQL